MPGQPLHIEIPKHPAKRKVLFLIPKTFIPYPTTEGALRPLFAAIAKLRQNYYNILQNNICTKTGGNYDYPGKFC